MAEVSHIMSQPLAAEQQTIAVPLTPRPTSATPLPLLPEDDGMGVLRQRVFSIQSRDISQNEKARLMHQLLREGYTGSQIASSGSTVPILPESPTVPAATSAERQGLSGRLQTLKSWYPLGDGIGNGSLDIPLTAEDLEPTYVPRGAGTDAQDATKGATAVDEQVSGDRVFGCAHYRRNVKMQCATCNKWYTCRFCHDEVENHVLPRKETRNMLCMACGCAQRASDTCVRCGKDAGRYFCGICNLWSDDPNKAIYHCHDCDICRVGQGLGKDFFHCHVSLAMALFWRRDVQQKDM
jgi:uncharacterized CHY-type Zn-finger protein